MNREQITGLVLAGGRGSRMGGVDKGLQDWHGRPLVRWMIDRLAPQVGPMMVSANRHLDDYRAFGVEVEVCTDETADFGGPLAGLLSGLTRCRTPFLASVPCDAPAFPADLVARLAQALERPSAQIAIASVMTPEGPRLQPVFAMLSVALEPSLREFTRQGGAKVREWMSRHDAIEVPFHDPAAFANFNTLDDLRRPGPENSPNA